MTPLFAQLLVYSASTATATTNNGAGMLVSPGGTTTTSTFTFATSLQAKLTGCQIYDTRPVYVRSGVPGQDTSATLVLNLAPSSTITGVSFAYKYVTGYKGTVGANFTLEVAGSAAYTSPTLNKYQCPDKTCSNGKGSDAGYSPPVAAAATGLSITVPSTGGNVAFKFHNVDKNIQLELPIQINITCAGAEPCFAGLAPPGSFDWIRSIAAGPAGQKVQLEAKTYLIDKQYQLPRGTELRGVGTSTSTGEGASGAPSQTVIKAVGTPFNACAGASISNPGLVQGRKGLLLGDDTYVGGFHFIGMETKRLDCLYAPIETPGCTNSEGDFPAPPNVTGGPEGPAGRNLVCPEFTGNGGHGVRNATVEDVTVEPYTTQNMFFMAPTPAGARVSQDITVRNMRVNGTWADGVNIHGQHTNVLVEGCTVVNSGDDCFALWSIGADLDNVTFKNNYAKPHPGRNCCFVNFGGLRSTFIDNRGDGCGLTPSRNNIPKGSEGLVIFGAPTLTPAPKGVVNELFGGAWNSSSHAIVKNVTGTCAGSSGCKTCNLLAKLMYPSGFPGTLSCQ